ncbi:MAG TPA: polymer-forming cytoskeletal protein [Gemmatimonadales bacterium]|jgi:hypothetical protein
MHQKPIRSVSALVLTALTLLAGRAAAQNDDSYTIHISARQQPDPRQLPRDVADEVIHFFNASGTLHFSGITRIPHARGVDGDVAVLGGPVTVAGHISGSLQVINGDLILEPGAVIGGDVLVVGGEIEGRHDATISGEVRAYRTVLRYRRSGDRLVYAPERESLANWRRHRYEAGSTSFVMSLGGTYNRVEGVPIVFGPRLNVRVNDGTRFLGDVRLIMRTGENFSLDKGRFGYRAQGEFRLGGQETNVGIGIHAYDRVSPIEPWPLHDFEAGWAAFLLHDDYRDWYREQGVGLYAALRPSRRTTLTIEGRQQDEISVAANDPFTMFNRSRTWRPNSPITDGTYQAMLGTLRIDTRNEKSRPSSGVLVSAEFEAGAGRNIQNGALTPGGLTCLNPPQGCPIDPLLADGKLTYQRGWLDARTYIQVTPHGRLNLRLAGGGKLGGEALPLQDRLSLGYPDPIPGYRFRQLSCGGDGYNGTPALCDRAIMAQVELRTHMGFDFGPDWANDWGDDRDDDQWQPLHLVGPDIVVFADAGYAWSVGSGPGQIPAGRLPSLGSFLPDLGLGLDLGPIGLYVAKSVGRASRDDLTFTLRLGRRF